MDLNVNKPVAKLIGENGNIFCLMSIASEALKKEGQEVKAKEMVWKVTHEAKSYNEALNIIADYVEIE